MSSKIEPCPFCGSNNLQSVTDDGIHFTQCKGCEATGPTGFKRGEDDAIDWNTRATVVERQPFDKEKEMVLCKAEWMKQSDVGLFSDFTSGWFACLNNTPPELAELQATIERLTAKVETMRNKNNELNDTVARLKAGQGEPVAWSYKVRAYASGVGEVWRDKLEAEMPDITTQEVRNLTPLYTSQPAPVSVVLDGWKLVPIEPTEAMLNVLHDRVLISVNSQKKEASIINDKAWWKAVVESAPSRLDKVKEMNQ